MCGRRSSPSGVPDDVDDGQGKNQQLYGVEGLWSNVCSWKLLLRLAPIKPPAMAPTTMTGRMDKPYTAKPVDRATLPSLEICEKRMVTIEHTVADLVSYAQTGR